MATMHVHEVMQAMQAAERLVPVVALLHGPCFASPLAGPVTFRVPHHAGLNVNAPWVEKYRPKSLDEVAAHTEIIDTSWVRGREPWAGSGGGGHGLGPGAGAMGWVRGREPWAGSGGGGQHWAGASIGLSFLIAQP